MKKRLFAYCVALSAALSGCGPILDLPGGGEASDFYRIEPVKSWSMEPVSGDWHLVVENPTAPAALENDRIALYPEPLSLRYYADVRWQERAPEMLRSALLRSLEALRGNFLVTERSGGVKSDYSLRLDLREFQAEYSDLDRAPAVRVGFKLVLIRRAPQAVVGDSYIEVTTPAAGTDMHSIIEAFDAAAKDAIGEAVPWIVQQVAADQG